MPTFHDLPTEIQQYTFTLCMDPPQIHNTIYCWGAIYDSFKTRISIILVSKAWKALAESTPGLWTLIQVEGDCSNEKNLSLAQTWLLRSGTLPINLIVTQPTSISEPFVQLLKSKIFQCRTIAMNLAGKDFGERTNKSFAPETILPSTNIELPNLKSLTSFRNYDWVSSSPYSIHAPHLRTLGLGGHALSTLGNLTTDTLHALHTLDIDHPAGPPDMRILINCPNLRHLMWSSEHPNRVIDNDSLITLPFLTNLSFFDTSYGFMPLWIKGFIKAPVLRHLSYMHTDHQGPAASSNLLHINEFATFSSTLITMRLTSFTLTSIPQGVPTPFFPNLTTLDIFNCKIEDAYFDCLNAVTGEDNKSVTRCLSKFNIDKCTLNVDTLEKWLDSRAASSHLRLPQMRIFCWDTQHVQVQKLAERYSNIFVPPEPTYIYRDNLENENGEEDEDEDDVIFFMYAYD
ncbi:hypothetical protein M422DRAFT_257036 [Sphaerobolus stellatus SS14]|uniref:F-box domain-containing protein n=1 Tax=Sphaerobolus stellatus (strain SS14) TaxID=990650 RepID=A0A0C9UZ89_SPHS4|nr:hypothetical protein M422DRAFT_257036 [Sphaerobolus stellatus SS14]